MKFENQTDIGALSIYGDISSGKVQYIKNVDNQLTFKFVGEASLIELEVEFSGETQVVRLEDFETVSEPSTHLRHPSTGIDLFLEWIPWENDVSHCEVHFKCDDPDVAVRSVAFTFTGHFDDEAFNAEDFLAYPKAAGMRIPNPRTELLKEKNIEVAKWNDRELSVWQEGFASVSGKDENTLNFNPSMSWLDYYCSKGGLYLASHDSRFEKCELTVGAKKKNSSLEFRVVQTFNSKRSKGTAIFAIGIHDGDWHRGADIYRAFFNSTGQLIKTVPTFMLESPGMICHYDFKWQNGTVNHRFKDIPHLSLAGREKGFKDMLVAGWNVNGFDNSYPEFRPDSDLGSEKELIDSIKEVHKNDGRIFFYVNAYSFDSSSGDYKEFGSKWTVKTRNGDVVGGQWGKCFLASMCNSCDGWREKVKENIKYVIETLGADGAYIDQLNVTPQTCFDVSHNHDTTWKLAYKQIINEVRSELGEEYDEKIFLFSEWLSDVMGSELDGQLVHTYWGSGLKYAFPEMFRYTFPKATLFDQVLQKPWPGIPVEVEGRHVKEIICGIFINGLRFWCYDHVVDSPELWGFFQKVLNLRKGCAVHFAEGVFLDDTPINDSSEGADVKAYKLKDGSLFFAVWNNSGNSGHFNLKEPLYVANLEKCDFNGVEVKKIKQSITKIEFGSSILSTILLSKT